MFYKKVNKSYKKLCPNYISLASLQRKMIWIFSKFKTLKNMIWNFEEYF